MKSLLLGFSLSALLLVASGASVALGSYLGFTSKLCPLFWPGYAYGFVGFLLLYPADYVPYLWSFFGWLVPGGGAPGVFAAVVLLSFFGWGFLLSVLIHYGRGRALTSK